MLVDDNSTDRRQLETLLGYRGYRVLSASDAQEGLDLIRREHPDLLISDILMPSMDGYELVRELRRDSEVGETPVIFRSARYLEGEARRLALACGVEHILTKPSEPQEVLAKVEEVLAGGFPLAPGRAAAGESAHLDHLRVLSAKLYEKVSELERVNEERQRLEGRLRELLDRMITAQEEERRRIAGDIHDDTIQVMGAVSARLHRLWARASDEAQLQLVSDVEETVRLAIGRLRALIFDLRPPALDFRGGLAGALREYLEKTPADSQLPFSVQGDVESATRTETQLILYRIAQEALINVRKHARATRVDVEIEQVDAGVRVRVRDDGVGFDPSKLESVPGHLGVTAMRERAELEGGWWCCASAPGEGTLVEFWVPL